MAPPDVPPTIPDVPVLVISGPSGSGKTTIVSRLIAECSVRLRKSVSATTRPARTGEINGQDYHFLTPEQFEQRRREGQFLECAEVHKSGYWYGTLISEVEQARDEGAWTLLEIDVEGAMEVMRRYPSAVTVFLSTPPAEYERRLRARGTESEEVIQRRLQTARQELTFADRYQYRVVNADLDAAVREICGILKSVERGV
jgi:guanylate kinase